MHFFFMIEIQKAEEKKLLSAWSFVIPLICSQFYIVLRLTVLRTTASLSVPLENHAPCDPSPPPLKKKTKFPPTPQAIKMTLCLISLFIKNFKHETIKLP